MNTNGFIIIDWDGSQWVNCGIIYPTKPEAQKHVGASSTIIHASFADCLDMWPSPEEMKEMSEDIASMESDNTFEEID